MYELAWLKVFFKATAVGVGFFFPSNAEITFSPLALLFPELSKEICRPTVKSDWFEANSFRGYKEVGARIFFKLEVKPVKFYYLLHQLTIKMDKKQGHQKHLRLHERLSSSF